MSSEISAPVAIQTDHLSKRYRLGVRKGARRIGESVGRVLLKPFRKTPAATSRRDLWALKDISITVREGEILGIIGPNGSGKSTLLRVLSRITRPTEGRAEIHGRVGALLEVGTGFHPELSGRDNVFLNGAILGMSRTEVADKYDDIVAFAQVPDFMDVPVKHYSSGMRVRLAFSVAAHLDPEILFIDEVLAVGDAAFQQKCLGKMNEVASSGRTVLFVSHNMGVVASLCTRAIWLKDGTMQMDDDPRTVIEAYLSEGYSEEGRWQHPDDLGCGSRVQARSLSVTDQHGARTTHLAFDEPIRIEVEHEIKEPIDVLRILVTITDVTGTEVMSTSNLDTGEELRRWEAGTYRHTFLIPASLLRPSKYFASILIRGFRDKLDEHEHVLAFEVLTSTLGAARRSKGVITPNLPWQLE